MRQLFLIFLIGIMILSFSGCHIDKARQIKNGIVKIKQATSIDVSLVYENLEECQNEVIPSICVDKILVELIHQMKAEYTTTY